MIPRERDTRRPTLLLVGEAEAGEDMIRIMVRLLGNVTIGCEEWSQSARMVGGTCGCALGSEMNVLESEWLGQRLASIPDADLFPLLNVGSSTESLRVRQQPHIDANIFAPLRARGGKIWHLDVKPDAGVDIVGDLLDPELLRSVSKLRIQSVLISNLLEHVSARAEVCHAVMEILPPGGYLIVSGPKDYPFHADPIDTMFRPTIAEVHAHFPATQIIESAILDSGNWRQWKAAERGRSLGRTLVRLLLPFYRPQKWWEVARQSPYILKHISAFALVMRKDGTAASLIG